jgi:hypothetical protein
MYVLASGFKEYHRGWTYNSNTLNQLSKPRIVVVNHTSHLSIF